MVVTLLGICAVFLVCRVVYFLGVVMAAKVVMLWLLGDGVVNVVLLGIDVVVVM